MGGSNLQTGIILLLCMVLYVYSISSVETSCYQDIQTLNNNIDVQNETSSVSLKTIIYAVYPFSSCSIVPSILKLIMDVIFLVSIWYFFIPIGKS